jgi:NAD(P)-dependent dehydrogenase (short-subunit alcohol dehydrogenase family)
LLHVLLPSSLTFICIHCSGTMSTDTKSPFGKSSTADEVLREVDVRDKVALVTGATTGIGIETARAFAAKGARVIITARNSEKGEAAVAQIKATEGGFEKTFAVNHLGHFLLVNKIASLVPKGGRIVNLSSMAVRLSPVLFDDINFEKTEYSNVAAYGQSKTANSLFTVALNKRLASKGVEVFTVHPGGIRTELARTATAEDMAAFADVPFEWKTVPQGAATSVWAATAPELTGTGGSFLADCGIWPIEDEGGFTVPAAKTTAMDPELAERLWRVSEEMVGEKFSF